MVIMIHLELWERCLSEELIWTKMILLTERRGGYRGIGIVELIWKTITSIINTRLRVTISINEDLHVFRQGRGTGK